MGSYTELFTQKTVNLLVPGLSISSNQHTNITLNMCLDLELTLSCILLFMNNHLK